MVAPSVDATTNTNGEAEVIRMTFSEEGAFAAKYAADAWCKEHGISVGEPCAGKPRGLLFGDFSIAKWRNLNAVEIAQLHGRMTGCIRNGPLFIEIDEACAPQSVRYRLLEEVPSATNPA